MTMHPPEPPERTSQPQCLFMLSCISQPAQSRPQVSMLAFQSLQPHDLLPPCCLALRFLRKSQVIASVSTATDLRLPTGIQALYPIFTDRFQHVPAWPTALFLRL